MKSILNPDNTCPNCKRLTECQSSIDGDHIPVEGDISVCLYCQCILVFDQDLYTVNPSRKQIDELKEDKELWSKIHKLRYYIKEEI